MNLYFLGTTQRFKALGYDLYRYLKSETPSLSIDFIDSVEGKVFEENDLVYSNYFADPDIVKPATVIGPDYQLAKYWNSKIHQYRALEGAVKIPKSSIYVDLFNVIDHMDSIKKSFGNKFVVASEYSEGGDYVFLFDEHSPADLFKAFNSVRKNKIRISEFISIEKEISCHVVIFKDNIFIGPILEQYNEDKVKFKGVKYPIDLSNRDFHNAECTLSRIADRIKKSGYLGVIGIDLILDNKDQLYLCELNPRKMGSCIMDSILIEMSYGIPLSVLDYKSVNNESYPDVLDGCIHPMEWSLEMSRDTSIHDTCLPGFEGQFIKSNTSFSVKYVDFYRPDDKRTFLIEGIRC